MRPDSTLLGVIAVVLTLSAADEPDRRLAKRIYSVLTEEEAGQPHMCFRLTNATHTIGCQSAADGNIGIVALVTSLEDAEHIAQRDDFYIAAIDITLLQNKQLMDTLRTSERFTGIIVLKDETLTMADAKYSPDDSCPNSFFGLYQDKACSVNWNSVGYGYMRVTWEKPIILITNSTKIQWIKNCYHAYNTQSTSTLRCAARIQTFMQSAVSSETCMRRSSIYRSIKGIPDHSCTPLGDQNIVIQTPLRTENSTLTEHDVMLILTKLDSFSLFSDYSPGAETVMTSLIAWMTINYALQSKLDQIDKIGTSKTVLAVALNGESFDYMGSAKMLNLMQLGQFPALPLGDSGNWFHYNLSHIGSIVEMSMIGASKFTIHVDGDNFRKFQPDIAKQQQIMKETGLDISLVPSPEHAQLPPTSTQYLLKEVTDASAIVVGGYGNSGFDMKHYNSIGDTIKQYADPERVVSNIEQVAKAILSLAEHHLCSDDADCLAQLDLTIDNSKVKRTFDCLIRNETSLYGCDELADYVRQNTGYLSSADVRERTYVKPISRQSQSTSKWMTTAFLAQWIGRKSVNESDNQDYGTCYSHNIEQTLYTYLYTIDINGNGTCWKTPFAYSSSLSPAFEVDATFQANLVDSAKYGAWTESVWKQPKYELFLVAPAGYEWAVFVVGIVILIVALVVVYICDVNSVQMFETHTGAI